MKKKKNCLGVISQELAFWDSKHYNVQTCPKLYLQCFLNVNLKKLLKFLMWKKNEVVYNQSVCQHSTDDSNSQIETISKPQLQRGHLEQLQHFRHVRYRKAGHYCNHSQTDL